MRDNGDRKGEMICSIVTMVHLHGGLSSMLDGVYDYSPFLGNGGERVALEDTAVFSLFQYCVCNINACASIFYLILPAWVWQGTLNHPCYSP